MDALSATSLPLRGSPPRRRDTVALALVALLAIATAVICLAVAVEAQTTDDRQMFGAIGLGLLAWLAWRMWNSRRAAGGTLIIDAYGLVAHDPAIPREPPRVPPASLRAAGVGRGAPGRRRLPGHPPSRAVLGGGPGRRALGGRG